MAGIKLYQFLLNGQVFKDPENWKNFIPTIETHEVYKTLLAQFSSETMIFVKDAKNYVDEQYSQKGALAKVTIQVKKYNLDTGLYENYFTAGRLDFKRYKRKRDRTEVGFEPSDFVMKVLNRDEVIVSLQKLEDMDGNAITPFTNEFIDLELDQQTFIRMFRGGLENNQQDETYTQPSGDFDFPNQSINYGVDTVEINELQEKIEGQIPDWYLKPNDDLTFDKSNPFYIGVGKTKQITVFLDIDILVRVTMESLGEGFVLSDFDFVLEYLKTNNDSENDIPQELDSLVYAYDPSNTTGVFEDSLSFNGSIVFTVEEGEQLFLRTRILPRNTFNSNGNANIDIEVTSEIIPTTFDIEIDEEFEDPTTTAKCMLAWEFILRQCQIITGRNDCLRSSFYGRTDGEVYQYAQDGLGSMYAFTNGKLVRGFPIEKAPINTFLMQTFKSLEGMGHLLGLGITYESDVPYITIEPLEFWKDKSTVVMTLQADKNDIEWEPALKYMWGSVKCGYKNYKNESSFLLGTAHALKEYSLADINEISNTIYEITSDFVGSGHLLENMRNQRYALDTQKDTDYDETIFVIAVKRDGSGGFERKKITEFESVTGIDNVDSQYNIELHPARVLLNHAPLLLAAYAKRIASEPTDKTFLQFRSGEANNDLATKYTGKPEINEGIDLTFDELDGQEALFDASEMGSCNVKLSDAQIQQFKSGFIGAINISDSTGTYKCLVDMVKQTNLENNKTELRVFKVIE